MKKTIAAAAAAAAMAACAPGAMAADAPEEAVYTTQEVESVSVYEGETVQEEIPAKETANDENPSFDDSGFETEPMIFTVENSVPVSESVPDAFQESIEVPEDTGGGIEAGLSSQTVSEADETEEKPEPALSDLNLTSEIQTAVSETKSDVQNVQTLSETDEDSENAFYNPSASDLIVWKNFEDAQDVSELEGMSWNNKTIEEIEDYYAENLYQYWIPTYDAAGNPRAVFNFENTGTRTYYKNGEYYAMFNEDGSMTDGYKQVVLDVINFYRWMEGLNPLVENTEKTVYAQAAAEYMNERDEMDHYLASDDSSEEGRTADKGLKGSNLAYAGSYINSIIAWMTDTGSWDNVSSLGHRNHLMMPDLTAVGFGQSGYYSTVYVFGLSGDPDYDKTQGVSASAGLSEVSDLYGSSSYSSGIPTLTFTLESDRYTFRLSNDPSIVLVRDDGEVYEILSYVENPFTQTEIDSAEITQNRWWFADGYNIAVSLAGMDPDDVYGHQFTIYTNNVLDRQTNQSINVKFTFSAGKIGSLPLILSESGKSVQEKLSSLPENAAYSDLNTLTSIKQDIEALSVKDQILLASQAETLDSLIAQAQGDKEQSENREKAQSVSNMIDALAGSITLSDEEAVEAAQKAYDALTSEQQALVANADKLKSAQQQLLKLKEEQKQTESDRQAASGCAQLIDAVPEDLDLDDESIVAQARESYSNLTDSQKQYISSEQLAKLEAAEKTIETLKTEKADQLAASDAAQKISVLPAMISLDDKEAVQQARKAYDALTDTQKAMVDASAVSKLEQAEASIAAKKEEQADKQAAQAVADAVAAADTDEALLAANDAYNGLTQAQKALVPEETLTQLNQKLADYEARENQKRTDKEAVENFEAKVNALPETAALTDKGAVEEARRVYDALTDTQKAMTSDAQLKKLEEALSELEQAYQQDLETARQAEEAVASFNRENLSLTDKDAFEAAVKAYEELTDTQKSMVSSDLAGIIQSVNERFDYLEKQAEIMADAQEFRNQLSELGSRECTIEEYKELLAVYNSADAETRAAIDSLCAEDWAWFQNKMNTVIAKDIQAADDAESFTKKLEDVTVTDGRDKSSVEALRQAYDALSDEAKAKLDESALTALEDQLAAVLSAESKQVKEVQAMIDALGDPSLAMREELDAIKGRLDAMRPGLSQSVSQNKYLEALAAVEQLEAQEKAEQAAAADMQAMINGLTVTDGSGADQVQAVRDAYDALDESIKNRVDAEKLIEAEQKLSEILAQEAKDVEAIQEGIANYQQSTLTYEDAQSILDLKEKADALRDGLKDHIDMDILNQLVDTANALIAEEKAVQDEVNAYQNQQNSTSVTSGLDQEAVEALRKAYDSLSDKAKERVSEDTLNVLEASLQEILKQEDELVTSIQESIDAIPDTITLDDQEDIEALRNRVSSIRDDLQNRLDLSRLENAEDRMTGLTIEDQLKDIPETYDPAYDELISLLGKQFDAMKDQTNLDASSAMKLESLLEQKAEYDRQKAQEADSLIGLIANDANENTIEAAKTAYNHLTVDQKNHLTDKAKNLVESPNTGTEDSPEIPLAAGAAAAALLGLAVCRKKKNA